MEDYKEITRESYDKHAEYFSEYFKKRAEFDRRREFKRFVSLVDNGKILDLGCGSGDSSLYFREKDLDPICVDISSEMIELCRKKGLDAFEMDLENLQFESNSFEGIWAVTSLLHVPKKNLHGVIEKLSKVLKKDGVLFVAVKEGEGEEFIVNKNDPDSKRFFSFWEEEELIDKFRNEFDLIESWKERVDNVVFIMVFFRNKKSA